MVGFFFPLFLSPTETECRPENLKHSFLLPRSTESRRDKDKVLPESSPTHVVLQLHTTSYLTLLQEHHSIMNPAKHPYNVENRAAKVSSIFNY